MKKTLSVVLIGLSLGLSQASHAMKADEPDTIIHMFLHNQPLYQDTYGLLPRDVSRMLAARTLQIIPIESWVLQKLKLPTIEEQFLSDPTPPEMGECPPTIHSTVALFSESGNLIAIGTDSGDVRLFDRRTHSWRRLIAERLRKISHLVFFNDEFLKATDASQNSKVWNLSALQASKEYLVYALENEPSDMVFPPWSIHQGPFIDIHDPECTAIKLKLSRNQTVDDCRTDSEKRFRYVTIYPEIQIREYSTNRLLQRIPLEGLMLPIQLHEKTNTLMARKRFWDGEKMILFDLTELVEMQHYFQHQIRLEQVLLLAALFQMARHKIKLDFNKFPELWPYYQNLPDPIKKALKKLVICHGDSSCTIL